MILNVLQIKQRNNDPATGSHSRVTAMFVDGALEIEQDGDMIVISMKDVAELIDGLTALTGIVSRRP